MLLRVTIKMLSLLIYINVYAQFKSGLFSSTDPSFVPSIFLNAPKRHFSGKRVAADLVAAGSRQGDAAGQAEGASVLGAAEHPAALQHGPEQRRGEPGYRKITP